MYYYLYTTYIFINTIKANTHKYKIDLYIKAQNLGYKLRRS